MTKAYEAYKGLFDPAKNLMRFSIKKIVLRIFVCVSTFMIVFSLTTECGSLKTVYSAGKARFVPALILKAESMPEGVFFEAPIGITSDGKGNVYICDAQANDIKKFDAQGNYLSTFGKSGQGPGDFSRPFQIVYSDDRIVVLDLGNRRLCALSPEGNFLFSKKIPSNLGYPVKLEALPSGDLIMEMERMFPTDPERPQLTSLVLFSSGNFDLLDSLYSHEVWKHKFLQIQGRGVNIPQPYSPSVHWDVGKMGEIVVGFSDEYKIGIMDIQKKFHSTFGREYAPIKVTAEDQKNFFNDLVAFSSDGPSDKVPEFLIENTKFPKYKPAFDTIHIDSEGNMLVHVLTEKDKNSPDSFDVFDSKGDFIASVQILENMKFPTQPWTYFTDDCFWQCRENEQGFIEVVKFRITN